MSPTDDCPSGRAAKPSMCERSCGDRAGWWAVSLPRSLTKIVSGWSVLSSGWNLRKSVPWANARLQLESWRVEELENTDPSLQLSNSSTFQLGRWEIYREAETTSGLSTPMKGRLRYSCRWSSP